MANIGAIEYGPDLRNGYLFGYGQNCEVRPADKTPESIVQEALALGWSNGCPRARYYVLESGLGADWMMNKYAATNQWFQITRNLIHYRLNNPPILDILTASKVRFDDEPIGIHEPLSVPESHKRRIAPMSAIEGYSTPRILLDIPGDQQTRTEALRQAVIKTGLEPWNFLAHLAATAVSMGAEPVWVLRHVYGQGVLNEEKCRRAFVDLAQTLEQHAPDVWKVYCNLPTNQKLELEIAEIPLSNPA